MQRLLLLLLLLFGCSKAHPKPAPSTPDETTKAAYLETSSRLTRFLDRGMVINLGGSDNGDSLIFSGIALGSLPCNSTTVAAGLRSMIARGGGALARHWDMMNQVSLDGALGLYWGVAHRLIRCPDEDSDWAQTMRIHYDYVQAHNGAINVGFKLPAEFDFVQQALFAKLGLAGQPQNQKLSLLASEVSLWAEGVKKEHAACYRAHLGWLALSASEALGYALGARDRDNFCVATSGMKLPIIDNYCGKDGLSDFLSTFQYNTWEYRHQRCPDWESADGNGRETPAVDRLIGLTEKYSL